MASGSIFLAMDTDTLLSELGFDTSDAAKALRASQTVVVGMSGGVDSSVCALLVKTLGYRTVGVFMKNWEDDSEHCTAEADWRDVRRVAGALDIPVYSVNFAEEYRRGVFEHFLSEYRQGHTPNPDILCNREIKFKVFSDYAWTLGADFVATGHYCRAEQGKLLKGVDPLKDQSYFLYAIAPEVLPRVLFPVGHLPKTTVRELAARFHLATAQKKDSTGVCFIGERDFKEFLGTYLEAQRGDFVDLAGRVLGQHDGICFYTLGQRKGLGIGGPGEPWFVAHKDIASNRVVLVQGEDHPALLAPALSATEAHWLTPVEFPLRCRAKIRYRQADQDCLVTCDHQGKLVVHFDEFQRAITPRQSIVFYQGEVCLGGAMIEQALDGYFSETRVALSSFEAAEGLASNP